MSRRQATSVFLEVPERIAKFIKKKQPKPKPKKQIQTAEKKKPTEEEKVKARKKAAKTGLLAFKNNFADLMDDVSEAKLGSNAKLSDQGAKAKSTSRSLVLSQARTGSAGIVVWCSIFTIIIWECGTIPGCGK